MTGRLTLATDHAQGQCQLTVNIKESVKLIKDEDIGFLTESWHEMPTVTNVSTESSTCFSQNTCDAVSQQPQCSYEISDVKEIKIEPGLGLFHSQTLACGTSDEKCTKMETGSELSSPQTFSFETSDVNHIKIEPELSSISNYDYDSMSKMKVPACYKGQQSSNDAVENNTISKAFVFFFY